MPFSQKKNIWETETCFAMENLPNFPNFSGQRSRRVGLPAVAAVPLLRAGLLRREAGLPLGLRRGPPRLLAGLQPGAASRGPLPEAGPAAGQQGVVGATAMKRCDFFVIITDNYFSKSNSLLFEKVVMSAHCNVLSQSGALVALQI